MPWVQSTAGVEQWVPDPTGSDTPAIDAPPRKLSLAEQIAATRAKQALAKAEVAAEPATEPAKPRKLSLAEQIAATRARAAGGAAPEVVVATPEQLTAQVEAEAAARAERFRIKEEAIAAADAAEAMRESEAARQADELVAVEADRVALAEMEVATGSRKLSLAEQIAVTRAKERARAREAAAAAAAAREQAAAAGTSAADPTTTADVAAADTATVAAAMTESHLPDHMREEVLVAVAAGRVSHACPSKRPRVAVRRRCSPLAARMPWSHKSAAICIPSLSPLTVQVDEAYMLLSAEVLGSLRSNPAYAALKRELMGRAESNKAAARALRSATNRP